MNLPLHGVDTLLLVTEGDVDDELGCHSYAFIKKPTRSSSATIVQKTEKKKGERAEGGVI